MATLSGSLYQDVLHTSDAVALLFGHSGADGPLQDYAVNNFLDNAAHGVTGTDAADTLLGNGYYNHLLGGGGDDTLVGTTGYEVLEGGAGDDRLVAGWQDNMLSGGAGDDALVSGDGNDILIGGSGKDTFVFTGGGGKDLMVDVRAGEDIIQIARNINGMAIHNAEDLAAHVSDVDGNAVVHLGCGDTVTLIGVSADAVKDDPSQFFHVK